MAAVLLRKQFGLSFGFGSSTLPLINQRCLFGTKSYFNFMVSPGRSCVLSPKINDSLSSALSKSTMPSISSGVSSALWKFGSYRNLICTRAFNNLSRASNNFAAKPSLIKALNKSPLICQERNMASLNQCRRGKQNTKKKRLKKVIPKNERILNGPQRKAIVMKLVIRAPKKPNSAQRKCAVLKLSNGKLITAYMPGQNPVVQEHGVVLFRGGRLQDCPGVNYKIIRGKFDMN